MKLITQIAHLKYKKIIFWSEIKDHKPFIQIFLSCFVELAQFHTVEAWGERSWWSRRRSHKKGRRLVASWSPWTRPPRTWGEKRQWIRLGLVIKRMNQIEGTNRITAAEVFVPNRPWRNSLRSLDFPNSEDKKKNTILPASKFLFVNIKVVNI